MENPPYVPYQAYKSKRHNRVQSNPQAIPQAPPPPDHPRPVSTLVNGHTYSDPAVTHAPDGVTDAEKRSIALLNGRNPLQRPVSMIDTLTQLRQGTPPAPNVSLEKVATEKDAESLDTAPVSPIPSPVAVAPTSPIKPASSPLPMTPPVSTPPAVAIPLPASPVSQAGSPKVNGKAIAQPTPPLAGPSTLSPTLSERPLASPRKSSTFRHIRPPSSKPPLPSSPLRSASMHVQSSALLPSPRPAEQRLTEPTSGRSSAVSSPAVTAHDRALPHIPALELHTHQPFSISPAASPSPTPIAPTPAAATGLPHRASSMMPSHMLDGRGSHQASPSPSPSPALTPSTSTSSAVPTAQRVPGRSPAPYRPGFQPKGVYRPRTDEFVEARNHSRDVGRIERTRLERRLEKLINLHFPPPGQERKLPAPEPRPMQQNRRASSFWDLDLSDLKTKSAGDLWRDVLQSQASQGGKNDIRVAEQKITPWEDDSSVSQCPICAASFHPLTNRKHHCRLCGRIVCSLPVKYPQRPETCSLLFVVDQTTGRIEEVGEGVDYGVRRRTPATPGKGKKGETLSEEEKFLKGVRICRECRPVLLRQQYRQEMRAVPLFTRLYEAFISLEKEIEDELPLFQELVVNLSKQERPTPEAAAARKRLLEAFSQYDALAKRIRKLPCPPGGSQDRIQGAIVTRANLFLQKHMIPLQSLPNPNPSAKKPSGSPSPSQSPGSGGPSGEHEQAIIDPDSEVARVLQPLLEQEALLETFVEEAKAHRKFEDAKTLKGSLREIRAEIERILANANGNGQAQGARGKGRT